MLLLRLTWLLNILIFTSQTANAQICRPALHSPLQTISSQERANFVFENAELTFKEGDKYKSAYAHLYVIPRNINVRDAPDFGTVVSSLFIGQKVRIYARTNNWVAITPKIIKTDKSNKALWVHIDYLSNRRQRYLSYDELKTLCLFPDMAASLEEREDFGNCDLVRNYLKNEDFAQSYKSELWKWLSKHDRKIAAARVSSNCF